MHCCCCWSKNFSWSIMSIRSRFMRFDARMWALGCKSSSYFDGVVGHKSSGHLIEKYLPNSLFSVGTASDRRYTNLESRSNTSLRSYQMGFYSSEADEQNADMKAEETRGARFRDELLSEIVPWKKTPVSFGNFPYCIEGCTKSPVECMPSHLKQNKFRIYGSILKFSDKRLQLQSIPGNRRHKSSLVRTPKGERTRVHPKAFCEWLAGVVDADGNIQVKKKGRTSLEITLGFEDLRLLRYIQNALGGGVKMRAGAKSYRYRLHETASMFEVMNCINGHIRHSARISQLHRVCQELKIPVILPSPLDAQSSWFAGFFDGHGKIMIDMAGGLPQLSIQVSNRRLQDVEPFKAAFGGGIYFDSAINGHYRWSAQSREDVTVMVDYFKEKTFRSYKSHRFFLIKHYYKLYDLGAFIPDSIHHKEWLAFLKKWDRPHSSAELKSVEETPQRNLKKGSVEETRQRNLKKRNLKKGSVEETPQRNLKKRNLTKGSVENTWQRNLKKESR